MVLDKYAFIFNGEYAGRYFKCETVSCDFIEKVLTVQTVGDLSLDPNTDFIVVIRIDDMIFLLDDVYVQMTSSLYNNLPSDDNAIKLSLINTYDMLFRGHKQHFRYTDLPNEIKLRMERIKLLES